MLRTIKLTLLVLFMVGALTWSVLYSGDDVSRSRVVRTDDQPARYDGQPTGNTQAGPSHYDGQQGGSRYGDSEHSSGHSMGAPDQDQGPALAADGSARSAPDEQSDRPPTSIIGSSEPSAGAEPLKLSNPEE